MRDRIRQGQVQEDTPMRSGQADLPAAAAMLVEACVQASVRCRILAACAGFRVHQTDEVGKQHVCGERLGCVPDTLELVRLRHAAP